MKIALCQVNPILGNFTYNLNKVKSFYDRAVKAGAELVVFPELVVCGYPPQDLIWESGFISECERSIQKLALDSTVPVIAGYIRKDKNKIFNSAAVCSNGELIFTYDKILLPTYDVFNEKRYFESGNDTGIIEIYLCGKLRKIGVQICEDLWDEEYDLKITDDLAKKGAEVIINISASPFHDKQISNRRSLIKEKVNKNQVPFVYCNLVGAQDELIFDGSSSVFNSEGYVVAAGKSFSEDLVVADLKSNPLKSEQTLCREEAIYSALCLGVKDYFNKTGHKKAVIGMSGGIDSSLTACVAVDALEKTNVLGISMPSEFSTEHSITDAKSLSENLSISLKSIPINAMVKESLNTLEPIFSDSPQNVAEENVQARLRGLLLMAISNKFGRLLLTTGNKTELALGYCTLYGDMNGGLAVISDLSKQDVYAVSKWVNEIAGYDRIPKNCIIKPPSAELAPEQVDPFDYDVVSPLVESIIQNRESVDDLINKGLDKTLVVDIASRIRINEYKRRQAAPGLRVTSKAFGIGRRYPIVNQFI